MGRGFGVQSDALRTYARNAEPDVGRIQRIRRQIDQLGLPDGTFGLLPQAEELKADYDAKREDSLRDLEDAAEALQSMVDAARDTAENYDGTEAHTVTSFRGE